MRGLAVLPLLLLAACGSSDSFGLPEERVLDCTNEIEIRVGLQGPGTVLESVDDRVTLYVEVANNSSRDIVVKNIRVEQVQPGEAPYRLDSGYGRFNQTILEAEEHQFEIPMTGRGSPNYSGRLRDDALMLAVTVSLEGGDSYRCKFGVRAPAA